MKIHEPYSCPLSPCINIKAHFLLSKGSLALSAFTTGSLGRSELRALKTAGEEKQQLSSPSEKTLTAKKRRRVKAEK